MVIAVLEKLAGSALPIRFLSFSLIGGLGVGTHLGTLWFATHVLFAEFAMAQTAATLVAMTGNFFLNNRFTYRDRRLFGRRLWAGLLSFYAVCGVGTVCNVWVAADLAHHQQAWWLAGIAGAAVSAVWNYTMSASLTWSPRPARNCQTAAQPAAGALLPR